MTVHVDSDRARDVARRVGWEIGQVERQHGVVKNDIPLALNDFGSLNDAQKLLSEFVEEATLLADILNARANISEAADNGAHPSHIAAMEEAFGKTLGLAIVSLTDGRGASGSNYEKLVGIELGYFEGDDIDQAMYDFAIGGDFDLATSLYPTPGGDTVDRSTWGSGITLDPSDYEGPGELVYYGGGTVLGPDGRHYPIINPVVVFEGEGPGGTNAHVSNGFDVKGDDGWTTIGYRTGSTQYYNEVPGPVRDAMAVDTFFGGDSGPAFGDEWLNTIHFGGDAPPRVVPTPASQLDADGYVTVAPGDTFGNNGGAGRQRAGGGAAAVDVGVGAYNAFEVFNGTDDGLDRAYEVVFEQHADGQTRARVTTFGIASNDNGTILEGWNHYVDEGGTASQFPASYPASAYPDQVAGEPVLTAVNYNPIISTGGASTPQEVADYYNENGQHLGNSALEAQEFPGFIEI